MSALDREFQAAVQRAREAQRKVASLSQDRDAAFAVRDAALVRAWRFRPDKLQWRDLRQMVCGGLDSAADITVSALRRAVREANGGSTPERVER